MKALYLKLTLAIAALVVFFFVGRHYLTELPRIVEASAWGVVAIAFIHTLTLWLQGQSILIGLKPFDLGEPAKAKQVSCAAERISSEKCFGLTVLGSYTNLLLPRTGIATTAAYLKYKCSVSFADFAAVTFYNGILFVFCGSAISIVAMHLHVGVHWLAEAWLFAALYALLLFSAIAAVFKWRFGARELGGIGWIKNAFRKLQHSSAHIAQSKFAGQLLLLNFAMAALRALRLGVACWAMGLEVSPLGVVLASALGDVIFVFSITPAALGFRECAIAFSASAMGISPELAISVAVFDRLAFSGTVVLLAQAVIAMGIRVPQSHKSQTSSPLPN